MATDSAFSPSPSPRSQGFYMPAEWEPQAGILLSYPLNPQTWPDNRPDLECAYAAFAAAISRYEDVYVNCASSAQPHVMETFLRAEAVAERIHFLPVRTNDTWCRDHGPIVLKNHRDSRRAVVDFEFNSWGGKFSPWDLDNAVPAQTARAFGLPCFHVPYIFEGGALEVNGAGALLTTRSVILNPNRNPGFTQDRAESILRDALDVQQVLWLESGMEGDDTDGHVDTLARFFGRSSVLAILDEHSGSTNRDATHRNFAALERMRLTDGTPLEVIPLPCPEQIHPEHWREEVLPASYANFLILNGAVLVPTYRQDRNDAAAVKVIAQAFPGRDIVPLDCYDIILEGGALHCLSQQIPL